MPFAFEWISGGRLRRSRLRYRYEAEALNINLTRGPVLNIREVYLNVWNERKKKKTVESGSGGLELALGQDWLGAKGRNYRFQFQERMAILKLPSDKS